MPRFELLLGRQYNRITVQTVRGCPLDCEFCGASKLYGPKYRRKPLEKVVAELTRIKELWGDNAFFELADDNSFAHPKWTKEFLTAIQPLDLRWFESGNGVPLARQSAIVSPSTASTSTIAPARSPGESRRTSRTAFDVYSRAFLISWINVVFTDAVDGCSVRITW